MNDIIQTVLNNLRNNRMQADYVSTKEEAVALVRSLIPHGSVVATGGSASLIESGVMDLLHSQDYRFRDRSDPSLTPQEREEATRAGATADVYLCSSNAVTVNGELYNVDGNCNRISAIAYGPKKVIMIVGINKIVPDLDAAVRRVKTIAAPLNTKRLHCDTYCFHKGVCMGVDGTMTDGCSSPGRICCNYIVSAHQRYVDRIHVILVGESLGF